MPAYTHAHYACLSCRTRFGGTACPNCKDTKKIGDLSDLTFANGLAQPRPPQSWWRELLREHRPIALYWLVVNVIYASPVLYHWLRSIGRNPTTATMKEGGSILLGLSASILLLGTLFVLLMSVSISGPPGPPRNSSKHAWDHISFVYRLMCKRADWLPRGLPRQAAWVGVVVATVGSGSLMLTGNRSNWDVIGLMIWFPPIALFGTWLLEVMITSAIMLITIVLMGGGGIAAALAKGKELQLLVVMAVIAAAILVSDLVRHLARLRGQRYRQDIKRLANPSHAFVPDDDTGAARGEAHADEHLIAPLSKRPCLAWRVLGRHSRGDIDDGACVAKMQIRAADGTETELQGEHAWLDLPLTAKPDAVTIDEPFSAYLAQRGFDGTDLTLAEAILEQGDHVEVRAARANRVVTQAYRAAEENFLQCSADRPAWIKKLT